MSDSIVVLGIQAHGRHGLGDEKDRPQPYLVDVELRVGLEAAATADRLDATIDYTDVAEAVRGVVQDSSFDLLETLAQAIATRLLDLGAGSVRVRASKPRAADALEVDEVAVVVER